MFDISFGELLVVFVLGLIVLGPQRLPVAVKTVAGWIRALRSLASSVQSELAHELKLQELQDSLKKVEKASLNNLTPELKESMDQLREATESMKRSYSPHDPEKESDEAHTIHDPAKVEKASEDVAPSAAAPESAAQPVAQESIKSSVSDTSSILKKGPQEPSESETTKSPEPTQPPSEKP
ncbi:Sec-independent protein translocase protein TatB [uncultured Cedecea sp.]|uniref:Sec-independent protein translocase protein TatB n=1 Tax=uncultured Cedecea sp. TaxID=988762 RepID=UPI00260A701C|nr:Sec-independent protein translocase protein TatB [uncultured Cedecea sp.]